MSAGVTLHDVLRDLARDATGFSDAAIAGDTIAKLAATLDGDAIARCFARDPSVVEAVRRAVVVGETSLFRQRDHFAFVADTVVPRMRARGRTSVRAWSAGCAYGEEAWSLAATLLASFPGGDVDVLGTDLLADHVVAAARAVCRTSSLRAPPLFPVVDAPDRAHDHVSVRHDVAACTHFAVHDLRTAPPSTGFDVILCRNVLLFFAPDDARRVVANLASALAPGGVLLFGPVDLHAGAPPDLVAYGPPELCAFERPLVVVERTPQPFARSRAAAKEDGDVAHAIALHLRALASLEDGDVAAAARQLAHTTRVAHAYVPGLVERALLLEQAGDIAEAREQMRVAEGIVAKLADDDVVVGPEPAPARFWRASIAAFSDRHRGAST